MEWKKIALMFLFQYDVGNLVHNSKKIPNLSQSLENNPIFWHKLTLQMMCCFGEKIIRVPIFPKNIFFCKLFKIISYGIS